MQNKEDEYSASIALGSMNFCKVLTVIRCWANLISIAFRDIILRINLIS